MLGAELIWLARGMQRIREQKQAGGSLWSFLRKLGAKHTRLASAIGMAREKYAAGQILDRRERIGKSGAIAFGVPGAGRTVGPILAEGQIAAQHKESRLCEGLRERYQQRCLAIRSGAMGKDKTATVGMGWTVEESAHKRVDRDIGEDLRAGFGGHEESFSWVCRKLMKKYLRR